MIRVDDKNQAIEMRKHGFSFSEIQKEIPSLPKSTLSGWLKGIELTSGQKARIKKKIVDAGRCGRQKGAWANKDKSKKRIAEIGRTAKKEFDKKSMNLLFLVGIGLYWAEGNQKTHRFQFTNSNPEMIKVMMKWLIDICEADKESISFRLYIHNIYKSENCEKYWSKILSYPTNKFQKTIFKPTKYKTKKNLAYKGCLKIDVKGSELYWKVQTWQKLLAKL